MWNIPPTKKLQNLGQWIPNFKKMTFQHFWVLRMKHLIKNLEQKVTILGFVLRSWFHYSLLAHNNQLHLHLELCPKVQLISQKISVSSNNHWSSSGVSNTRYTGRMWPALSNCLARVFIKNLLTWQIYDFKAFFTVFCSPKRHFFSLCGPRALFFVKVRLRIDLSFRHLAASLSLSSILHSSFYRLVSCISLHF